MDDVSFMKEALLLAQKAISSGEIPIGAVLVQNGNIIGRGYNLRHKDKSPLAHAEIIALNDAAANIGSWRFDDCTLYVTLEPCVMCAGAMVQCRVGRVVYGARDPKAGAAGSLYDILRDVRMYHNTKVTGGVLAKECALIMSEFFMNKRSRCTAKD